MQVNVPNVGLVNFPDSMSQDEVVGTIKSNIIPQASYSTPLNPQEEQQYQSWKQKVAPNDSGVDYDFRGAFKSGLTPSDNGHWPDTYKKPNHPTFSNESIYAKQNPQLAGSWKGATYVPPVLNSFQSGQEGPQLVQGHPSFMQRIEGDLSSAPFGSTRYNIGKSLQQAPEALFGSQKPIFQDVNQNPQTVPQALGTLAKSTVNSLATPSGFALGAVNPTLAEANPVVRSAIWKLLGLAFAPQAGQMIGQGLGQATASQQTPAQRVMGFGEAGQGAVMATGAVTPHILPGLKQEVVTTPQIPRPGTPEYIDYANKVSNDLSNRRPTIPATSVALPTKGLASKNPTVASPLPNSGAAANLAPDLAAKSVAANSSANPGWSDLKARTSQPTKTIMDTEFSDVRHNALPWLTDEQRKSIAAQYITGKPLSEVSAQANQLKQANIQQRITNAKGQQGQMPTMQTGQALPQVQSQSKPLVPNEGQVQEAAKATIPRAVGHAERTGSTGDGKSDGGLETPEELQKQLRDSGQTGAVFPTPPKVAGTGKNLSQIRGQRNPLETLRDKFVASIKTTAPKEQIVRLKDAADNQARLVGAQARNGLQAQAKQIFGHLSDKALEATTAAIETEEDVKKLDSFLTSAKSKNDVKGIAAATFAKNNWERLQPLVQSVQKYHDQQLSDEQGVGLDTQKREGYIKHAFDVSKLPNSLADTFLGTGSSSGDRGFLKQRTFPTLYDAIDKGYGSAIKSWNAANLVENRLSHGQQMVNDVKWMEGLQDIKEPTTKLPIVTKLIKRTNEQTGDTDLVPPSGYETWSPFNGVSFAVHRGYRNLFDSITSLSQLRGEYKGIPIGQIAMKGAGTLKHSMLLFDSYHAMRMTAKGLSLGTRGYGKGLSLLEYSDKDLDTALKNGDIDQAAYDYAKDNRDVATKLIKGGLNVARVQEGLDSEVITHLLPSLGEKIGGSVGKTILGSPGVFNRWVFEKLTRGIMMESGIREYTRLRKEDVPDAEAIQRVVKDTNTYFGNLGRQGVFRSKTFQDISKLIFLAPQWVESMAKTEAKSILQAGKYVGQLPSKLMEGKKPTAGTLLKGTSALILATFAATQVANLATRGNPTWENPEEGHQLDAWIPGGRYGFWVTPFSLPTELTHDVIRYSEAGKSPLQTASQMFQNKESPLFRSEEAMRVGEDYTGRKLTDVQRLETGAKNLLPLPLPLQPAIEGGYPGQVQRQLMASAGVKAEPVSSPRSIVNNLRRQFLFKLGKAGNPTFNVGEHQDIVNALQDGDINKAKEAYQTLLQKKIKENQYDPDPTHKSMEEMQEFFKEYANNRGQADKPTDAAFVKTLTYHQKELYDQVMVQQKAIADKFFAEVQPPIDNRPRGFKAPELRKMRGFSKQY